MIAQLGILLFGISAVLCTQLRSPTANKWAPILGMCSQPFWLYSAWIADQWGIVGVNIVYTFVWGLGIYNRWIRA